MSTLFGVTQNYLAATFARTRTSRGKSVRTETASTFIGTVQPASGKDLESVPIGRRDKGIVKVFSGTELNVGIEGSNKSGDIILHQSKRWEIIQEMAFQNNLISHYKYFAMLKGNQ